MFLRLLVSPRPTVWMLEALALPTSIALFSPSRVPARLGGSGGMFGMSDEKAVLAAVASCHDVCTADAVVAPIPLPMPKWLCLSGPAIVCRVCVIVFACS